MEILSSAMIPFTQRSALPEADKELGSNHKQTASKNTYQTILIVKAKEKGLQETIKCKCKDLQHFLSVLMETE